MSHTHIPFDDEGRRYSKSSDIVDDDDNRGSREPTYSPDEDLSYTSIGSRKSEDLDALTIKAYKSESDAGSSTYAASENDQQGHSDANPGEHLDGTPSDTQPLPQSDIFNELPPAQNDENEEQRHLGDYDSEYTVRGNETAGSDGEYFPSEPEAVHTSTMRAMQPAGKIPAKKPRVVPQPKKGTGTKRQAKPSFFDDQANRNDDVMDNTVRLPEVAHTLTKQAKEPTGNITTKKPRVVPQPKKGTGTKRQAKPSFFDDQANRNDEDMYDIVGSPEPAGARTPKSKPDTKKRVTGPNSKKKRTAHPNARHKPSNMALPQENVKSLIAHFDPRTGPAMHHQPDVEQGAAFEPLHNPTTGAEDMDQTFAIDDFQGEIGVHKEEPAKPARKSRVRKQSPSEADNLPPAAKKPKLPRRVNAPPVLTIPSDTPSSGVSDDASPNVESKTPRLVGVLSGTISASNVNKKQPKATPRNPLEELKQPISGPKGASWREQARSTPPPTVRSEIPHLLPDYHDVPSNQEQASRSHNPIISSDDVFISPSEGQSRPNTSFVDNALNASARQQPEPIAPIQSKRRVAVGDWSQNNIFSYDSGDGGRRRIPNIEIQNGSSEANDRPSNQQHHENKRQIAVDTATAELQDSMHAATQMVLQGLNSKKNAVHMVAEEYQRNGEKIVKRVMRKQQQELEAVHDAFRTDLHQLATIYDDASKSVERIEEQLSSIATKFREDLKKDRIESRNRVSAMRAAAKELMGVGGD